MRSAWTSVHVVFSQPKFTKFKSEVAAPNRLAGSTTASSVAWRFMALSLAVDSMGTGQKRAVWEQNEARKI
jgi:hypothetical protein